MPLDVVHFVGEVGMDLARLNGLGFVATDGRVGVGRDCVEELRLVGAGATADQVGVVGGRADADRLSGTSEQVAHVVSELLEGVGCLVTVVGTEDLV